MRSSSALEGYHQHFDDAVASCAKNTGLRLYNAVTNQFDFRWTVRALTRACILPKWVRHYNFQLYDLLYDSLVSLHSLQGAKSIMPGWRRTKFMRAPLVRSGVHYGLEAKKVAGASSSSAQGAEPLPSMSDARWVSNKLGSPTKLRTTMTATDADLLLSAGHDLSNAPALVATARANGLLLSAKAASSFGEKALADQAALLQLNDAGFKSLQQRLRVRVPAQPHACMPFTGLAGTDGTTELPGPQPGMPVMEMHQVSAPDVPPPAPAAAEHPTEHSDDESAPDLSQMSRKEKKAYYEKQRRKRRLPEQKAKENQARQSRKGKARRLARDSTADASD